MRPLLSHFDPEMSVNSGQVFLWEKRDRAWYGVHADRIVKFSRHDGGFDFETFPESRGTEREIFRLDDDSESIAAEITRDPFVQRLVSAYPASGL
ncbi:hypothetical protein [Candidatus Nitrososphaera sp. FF02]|uniref:hypothetical protein n=1 Tax=Candidatus Nitrososphaera sp. FF02 TaxID=3398226 RepID=UPI0039EBC3D1